MFAREPNLPGLRESQYPSQFQHPLRHKRTLLLLPRVGHIERRG